MYSDSFLKTGKKAEKMNRLQMDVGVTVTKNNLDSMKRNKKLKKIRKRRWRKETGRKQNMSLMLLSIFSTLQELYTHTKRN